LSLHSHQDRAAPARPPHRRPVRKPVRSHLCLETCGHDDSRCDWSLERSRLCDCESFRPRDGRGVPDRGTRPSVDSS
jgi:hypothetical protein